MIVHCAVFRDFVVDDAAISFSYARSLAQGDGLVLTPGGERVEGYSNFLWVLLIAAGVRLGISAFLMAKILGMCFAALSVIGAGELLAALRGRRSIVDAAPAALTAALTPIPYWSMSGLENSLFICLGVFAATRLIREVRQPQDRPISALLVAAMALTRPDGVTFVALACVLRLLGDRSWRRLLVWYSLALGPIALHVAWRLAYYAHPLPNTYYAKAADLFKPRDLWNLKSPGWKYVLGIVRRYELWPLLGAAALALLRWEGLRARLTVVAFVGCAVFFPLYARGDWMSEGRFVVGALPLAAVLAVDGVERLASLLSPSRVARFVQPVLCGVAIAALGAITVPRALTITKQRRGHYPVPVENVAVRAREYARLASLLEVARPSALDADLGGTSYYAGMPIIDLASLTDVTVARWRWHSGVLREYVYGERRPTFTRIGGIWTDTVLHRVAEFRDLYLPLRLNGPFLGDLQLARAVLLRDGVDTRRPLARFEAAGIDVLAAEVTAESARLWLLVRCDGGPGGLTVRMGGRTAPVVPARGLYASRQWRAGDILEAHSKPGSTEGVEVCNASECIVLDRGISGSVPVSLPSPSRAACERATARGDLATAVTCATGAGRTDSALGRALHRRAAAAEAAGDVAQAFADYTLALAVDPSRSFSRRRLEALRLAPRETYRYAWVARLDGALRELHLDPTPAGMSRLAAAALQARRPEVAVRSHLATSLVPADDEGRLDLAEAYLRVGLPEAGATLLPSSLTTPEAAARAQAVALAAGRDDAARAAARQLRKTSTPVVPGIRLVHAWGAARRSGEVELILALEREGQQAPATITVAGRTTPLARAPGSWAPGEVYLHRVPLRLHPGPSIVQVGAAAVHLEVEPFTHDFEQGTLAGWTTSGKAFGATPRKHLRARATFGFQGDRYLDTFTGNDRALGTLRSPVIRPDAEHVCFLVGGGRGRGTGVGLEVAGAVKARAAGLNDEVLREACLDARPYAGEAVRIVVLDNEAGAWGHVLADDFECLRAGRPIPCAGRVTVTVDTASR